MTFFSCFQYIFFVIYRYIFVLFFIHRSVCSSGAVYSTFNSCDAEIGEHDHDYDYDYEHGEGGDRCASRVAVKRGLMRRVIPLEHVHQQGTSREFHIHRKHGSRVDVRVNVPVYLQVQL